MDVFRGWTEVGDQQSQKDIVVMKFGTGLFVRQFHSELNRGLDVGGFWWAAIPREQWPDVPGFEEAIKKNWNEEVGDCRQEMVFIGIGMNEIALYDSLQKCLWTDEELVLSPEKWAMLDDPFPLWNVERAEA